MDTLVRALKFELGTSSSFSFWGLGLSFNKKFIGDEEYPGFFYLFDDLANLVFV